MPAPKVQRESAEKKSYCVSMVAGKVKTKKIFRASRFVPALKVQRGSPKKKILLRFHGCRHGKDKKKIFRASRFVPALKVQRESAKKKCHCAFCGRS